MALAALACLFQTEPTLVPWHWPTNPKMVVFKYFSWPQRSPSWGVARKTSKRCTRTMSHVHNVWRAKKHYKDLKIGCVVMYAIVLLLCHEKASATWELKVTNRSDWLTTCCQVVFREFAVVLAMRSISTWHAPHQDLPITSPLKMTNHEVISSEPPDLLQQRSP